MTADTAPIPSAGADTASRFRERMHGRHYPALDGLRGVAFLAVFLAHFYTMIVPDSMLSWGGWLGVDLFFVLSGFLITGILFDTVQQPRYFKTFYVRRALRIFPLYYSVWVIFLLLTPWLHPLWTVFDLGRVLYVINLMSFYAARHPSVSWTGFLFHLPGGRLTGFNVGHLWSLALEEQFYLVWPLLIFLLRERRRIMLTCALGIVASVAMNSVLLQWALRTRADRTFLYIATYAHVSPMLFGGWVAMWLRGREAGEPVNPMLRAAMVLLPVLLLSLTMGFLVHPVDMQSVRLPTVGYVCSGMMGAGLVVASVSSRGWTQRVLSQRWLVAVGRISYGMYVFHGFFLASFSHHVRWFARHRVAYLLPVCAFAVTFALASVSYRVLELPFLRLKDRLAPSASDGQGKGRGMFRKADRLRAGV